MEFDFLDNPDLNQLMGLQLNYENWKPNCFQNCLCHQAITFANITNMTQLNIEVPKLSKLEGGSEPYVKNFFKILPKVAPY